MKRQPITAGHSSYCTEWRNKVVPALKQLGVSDKGIEYMLSNQMLRKDDLKSYCIRHKLPYEPIAFILKPL